jgi:hypothetical protein
VGARLGRRAVLALTVAGTVAATLNAPRAAAATIPTTRVRMMTCNFRVESDADIAAGHGWTQVRKALALSLLKAWNPSVICGQECSTTIRADLLAGLGSYWKLVRNGNVVVLYDSNQHSLIGYKTAMLPSPGTDPRRLTLANLQMKATGRSFWPASTHFTPDSADWQAKQMQAVVDFIKANGDMRNTILGGDLNTGATATGPRLIGRTAGLFPLRDKLAAPRIINVTSDSYNGWQQPAPHDGLWIDDVCTGENWSDYYGRVVETNGASDHNWIIASSIQLT